MRGQSDGAEQHRTEAVSPFALPSKDQHVMFGRRCGAVMSKREAGGGAHERALTDGQYRGGGPRLTIASRVPRK